MKWQAVALKAIRLVFFILIGSWVFYLLFSDPDHLDNLKSNWRSPEVWIAIIGWIILPLCLGLLWRMQVKLQTGINIPYISVIYIQSVAWAGRYLPSKAGLVIAKAGLALHLNIGWKALTLSVFYEQLIFILASALLAAMLFVFYGNGIVAYALDLISHLSSINLSTVRIAFLFLMVLLLVSAFLTVYYLVRQKGLIFLGGIKKELLLVIIGHMIVQFIIGISLFPFFQQYLPETAQALGPLGISGAIALSNLAGIAAFFAPAGLGVREVVLAFLFSVNSDYETALNAAIMLRLITIISDLIFLAMGLLLKYRFSD